ncbi:MAG: GntR family transcriptional regulator [Lentisphaerae bacterium]|nr:GntR family transcriptional regulator [Lentisphaerota bacterium]
MGKEIEIADLMEKFIREGIWKAGEKIPSEHELAELYQINHKTANKAVAKLVEKGLVVRTVGRGGSKVASCLPAKGVIAYRLPLLSAGVFCSQLLKGVESAARAANYDLKYFELSYPEDPQWLKIANAGICGAVFTACAPPPETFPFPAINALHPIGTNFIASDDSDGGRQAAELFLANGHRNIAVISDNPNEYNCGRCDGFISTLKNNGIMNPEKLFFSIPLDNEINIRALWNSISSLPQKVTGAFCYSDTIAMHLLLHLNSVGIKVPQDFSICGFGNMMTVNQIMPLTTVRQFPETIGYTACTKLIELIENPDSPPIRLRSPVELINPRNTVAQNPDCKP